ncbi:MAG TPA: adenine deaminase [Methanomassiliicoccales archaeon]|nr:adenine deaminase [Methanomassiliicoccales archaeon]HPR97838.1 adenine deaminase [Methanomassiliicoccales archaeon]
MSRKSVEGQLVDVVNGKIVPSRVIMEDGKFSEIVALPDAPKRYLLPGLIDSHIHIESSQLCPSRFAEAAVPHGTTAVVSDPHEIANVLGMNGIELLLEDAANVPLRTYLTAPSCVPATQYERSGATIGVAEIEAMLKDPRFVGLGEVMDVQGVLKYDPLIIAKIKAAKSFWKGIDGHCPGLVGKDLVKYINAGMRTDHESLTADEAEEKYFLGMWIQVREGSASRDLLSLMPFAKTHECMLVSDDLRARDLVNGHLDVLLRKAVALGMPPMHAIRAVTAWPAWHYNLPGGSVAVGRTADLVVVDDLRNFNVLQVYIAGRLVAEDGVPLFLAEPRTNGLGIMPRDLVGEDMLLPAEGQKVSVRVIEAFPDRIESGSLVTELPVRGGQVRALPEQDVLHMALVNRYVEERPVLGFVKGFGLRRGAMATSVAHDSHHILAVGASIDDMARAINAVSRSGGFAVCDGSDISTLPLDLAGLMSTSPARVVAQKESELVDMLAGMGCRMPAPFMTLSFQSLLVVPELKMSDRGLFDTRRMVVVPPLL